MPGKAEEVAFSLSYFPAFLRVSSWPSCLRGEVWICTLSQGRESATRQDGFTLIELLVVLLIMGLFVGLVSTIVRPDDRAMVRVEAQRLAQLLDLAATKARLTGRPIAWTAEGPGYRFWQFSDETYWTEIRDDDALRARVLPQGMTISALQVENMPSPQRKRLEFSPYGQTQVFSVELTLGSASDTVAGSPIGEVSVVAEKRRKL
jgi:general secretion pathway protein H